MKSFSIKALALACVVAVGSAQGMFSDADMAAFTQAGNAYQAHTSGQGLSSGVEMATEMAASAQAQNKHWADAKAQADLEASFSYKFKGYVKAADAKLFGVVNGDKIVEEGYRPFSTLHNYCHNGVARYVIVAAVGAGIIAGIYKGYKYFTKPAADATVEGENVDANTEVVS